MKGPDGPGLKPKEEKMTSLKIAFGRVAIAYPRVSIFALVLLILAIDDDKQSQDKKHRKKRKAAISRTAKPPAGPRP